MLEQAQEIYGHLEFYIGGGGPNPADQEEHDDCLNKPFADRTTQCCGLESPFTRDPRESLPLEFDGLSDSLYHPYDREGRQRLEYIRNHGGFDAATGSFDRIDIRGEGGQKLKDHWANGARKRIVHTARASSHIREYSSRARHEPQVGADNGRLG